MGSVISTIVRNLQRGKVVTYGDISRRVYGNTGRGRAVGATIRAKAQEPGFPWWRVVNRKLHPTQAMKDGRRKLEDEGVEFCEDGSVKPRFYDPEQIGPR